ncbi:MAG: V-type ATP synthase subunit E family protein [Candidatus Nanohaloarchaea archaeon]
MGLQDVKTEIIDEAEREAEQIRSEAEEQKQEILEEAEERKQEILEEAETEAEERIEALRKKELSSARMEARQMKMEARQDVLDDAFEAFRDAVHDLDSDTEAELVEDALEALADRIDIGTVTVADAFEDIASAYGTVETDDVRGVIVESADGSRRFDMRFDRMADRTIEEHRQEVAEVLFDDE